MNTSWLLETGGKVYCWQYWQGHSRGEARAQGETEDSIGARMGQHTGTHLLTAHRRLERY